MAAQNQPDELHDDPNTTQFTVRMHPALVAQLDHQCRVHGVRSRNEFLNLIVAWALQKGFLPIRDGEGLKATRQSLTIIIKQDGGVVTSGSSKQLENAKKVYQTAYETALSLAQSGDWQAAKDTLEAAGFRVIKTQGVS